MKPKLSIVTPSFNQAQYLEQTILSVLQQNYENLEYIIIDGGSSDESVEVIKKYADHIHYWVSEKDRGQVHALNKGIEQATGEFFAFINSDDVFLPGAFNAVIDYLEDHPDCEWLCGDTIMFGDGFPTEVINARVPRSAAQALSWSYKAPQPGMFWKKKLIEAGFDEKWPYDFDHDMYVRLLLAGHRCEHLPVTLAAYRLHTVSKTVAEGDRQIAEFERSAEVYENLLEGGDRRWCRATRYLRRSYAASSVGNRREGARWLLRALATHPEGLAARPFWGTFRRLAKADSNSLPE
ncbi:MAG TPA: glycosyltransferase family 2 protein [Pyrinomonadaceae bacterium]|nr:glycosyltransferase family 2 protein [Pyrinomonadaceae bacterium]